MIHLCTAEPLEGEREDTIKRVVKKKKNTQKKKRERSENVII